MGVLSSDMACVALQNVCLDFEHELKVLENNEYLHPGEVFNFSNALKATAVFLVHIVKWFIASFI